MPCSGRLRGWGCCARVCALAVPRSFAALTHDQAQAILQVHPEPVAAIRRPGRAPQHVLLFGNGILQGAGLTDHRLGLPGRLAEGISTRRARGVSLDVIVHPDPTSPGALGVLSGMRIRRYDAVIVVLESSDAAGTQDERWRGALVGLVDQLVRDTAAGAAIALYDSSQAIQPIRPGQRPRAARAAERFTAISEEVCALSGRIRFGVIPPAVLPADPTRGFADGSYQDWADWMIDRLEPALRIADRSEDDASPRQFRARAHVEQRRQQAVDALRLRPGDRHSDLDREVRRAKLLYDATLAAFTVVDRDTLWSWATTGSHNMLVDRAATPCDIGVRSEGLLVIDDLWEDERTRDHPALRGPQPLRSYAGYPVHSWDGYRVGMVCLFAAAPGRFHGHELADLRDIAAQLEVQLWRKALRVLPR